MPWLKIKTILNKALSNLERYQIFRLVKSSKNLIIISNQIKLNYFILSFIKKTVILCFSENAYIPLMKLTKRNFILTDSANFTYALNKKYPFYLNSGKVIIYFSLDFDGKNGLDQPPNKISDQFVRATEQVRPNQILIYEIGKKTMFGNQSYFEDTSLDYLSNLCRIHNLNGVVLLNKLFISK
jgi:hypothetical protein